MMAFLMDILRPAFGWIVRRMMATGDRVSRYHDDIF